MKKTIIVFTVMMGLLLIVGCASAIDSPSENNDKPNTEQIQENPVDDDDSKMEVIEEEEVVK